ncbi:MAG: rhomboid family intramembrane serine protease [Bacteroidetes bacterium]|nr:rhomboid family intramembrane serine protease [Bacteroidota bacterium]
MEFEQYLFAAPVASFIFLATIVASFFAFRNPHAAREFMLHPFSFIQHKKYYQPITSGFIHADWMHLIFNMVSYFFFAFPLEIMLVNRAGGMGHFQFFIIYILSMVLADAQTIYKHRNNYAYFSLGASGAVTAVIFSLVLFWPTMKLYLMGIPFPIPAPIYAMAYVGFSIYAAQKQRDNINHEAHLGGAFAGLIITTIFYPTIWREFFAQLFGG